MVHDMGPRVEQISGQWLVIIARKSGDVYMSTIAKLTQKNLQDVHYLLAMHFYVTGALFV
jgi:hypothetical protein